ncbi:MAG: type II toxin-antitoxin system HicB family antitoxin [Phycisphaeraceae bacterium]|nr:type II toxin-antitoxin system HicB family antitoxin [Phycisphaeraceae bacterium]
MMEHKGYLGKVEFDAEAGILHGEVVGIRDVVTFQGESVEEVEEAFRQSIDDYLAFCKERGEEPDKPCSGRFVVRIDSELHRKLNLAATAAGESLNSWVSQRLAEAVADRFPIRKVSRSSRPPKKAAMARSNQSKARSSR